MQFTTLVFYIFSAILVLASLRVITARNPVHSAMSLVLAFFTAACLWMLLEAEFLAIVLVLVYVGAVMVLFVFVVMMLDINIEAMRKGFWSYAPLAGLVGLLMVLEMVTVLGGERFGLLPPPAKPADYSNTREIGLLLYTDYVYAFELAAVILLVAIVAAIALTLRRRPGRKWVDPATQVRVRRNERLRIVSVRPQKAEAKPAEEDA